MKKQLIALLLSFTLLFSSLSALAAEKHSSYIWDTFDTVVTLLAYTDTQEEYDRALQFTSDEMLRLHQIFDRYHAYEGVANLYALNENAGKAPFRVEKELFDLLTQVNDWRERYSDRTNPAMGAVLELWHQAREDGSSLPEDETLREAAKHCSWEDVILDAENQTVFFQDPLLQLDLGAVAKGYSAQIVADELYRSGVTSFILNAGGNVVTGDAPMDGRSCWSVGVENLDGQTIRCAINVTNTSVVTSGDYQRYYVVGEKRYHHLIDPDTLYPGEKMRAVTLVCKDSGLADFLSTSLFLLSYEEGLALVESIEGLEAMWTLPDESVYQTDGFAALLKK